MCLFAFRSPNASHADANGHMAYPPASTSTHSSGDTDVEAIKQQLGKCALVIKAFQKHTAA